MPRQFKSVLLMSAFLLAILLLLAFQADNVLPQVTVLYDGKLGGTPDEHGFSFVALGTAADQHYVEGLTVLDTTGDASDQAGYFNRESLSLDRQLGYKLHFAIQLLTEQHRGRRRAGFSVLVISEDLLGLELGFWQDEIWVQEGGTGQSLFKPAEGVAFDTTAGPIAYELAIYGDTYRLSAEGVALLSGSLRDYTAFEGFPDPYESPNLLFLGDNTGSASADTAIYYVAVEANTLAVKAPVATDTLQPGLEISEEPFATSTMVHTPQATLTVTPTPVLTHWRADRIYQWYSCLKGLERPDLN